MKTLQYPLLALLIAAVAVSPAMAKDKPVDPKLAAKAKLTQAEAEAIALKAVPNAKVKASELEEEDGGLRWSFDLNTPGSKDITEVGVDAMTGKVVENKVESKNDEAKEKDEEKDEDKKEKGGKEEKD